MHTRAPAKRQSDSRKDPKHETGTAEMLETMVEALGDLARRITALETLGGTGSSANAVRFEKLERHLEEMEERLAALEEERGL